MTIGMLNRSLQCDDLNQDFRVRMICARVCACVCARVCACELVCACVREVQCMFSISVLGTFAHSHMHLPPQTLVECRERAAAALGADPEGLELSMGMSADFEHAVCYRAPACTCCCISLCGNGGGCFVWRCCFCLLLLLLLLFFFFSFFLADTA